MNDTYAVAQNIREITKPKDKIFIWGTNPMLYALSRRDRQDVLPFPSTLKISMHIETMASIEQTQPQSYSYE